MKNKECALIEMFGSNAFNDSVMRERLPLEVYQNLKKTIDEGAALDPSIADVVADAMKEWAIEHGATHFTHWFQPMTEVTAEKHDAFIMPTGDGRVMMEFSGKELTRGESDASSFPSGGLRATFEARGYTAWDCTSPAFLREDAGGITLCIPTAFYSYTGEALDMKVPLLRSMEAVSKQAVRVLHLFGKKDVKRVVATVGPEQEYFLIDEEMYNKRPDLVYTGRTVFGARPPKGQELDDHYYGVLTERIASFMKELDEELWKMGVTAKTKHNEVAPAQHELAIIYCSANIASDHNQMTMEALKRIAHRHGLVCLLHEKPFKGINGSGKHNNWSLTTDQGENLFNPGKTPWDNAQFLIFLCAVIEAIDTYPELLNYSASNAGNDHRLGGDEAPPAIMSVFLGDDLTEILEQIEKGEDNISHKSTYMKVGVSTLPRFRQDTTDRNRTSPFAFTGNKFEFRMVPSSASIAEPNTVINTIVAETLCRIADELEHAENFNQAVNDVIVNIIKKHKRIIFNGNGYSKDWMLESKHRHLSNVKSMVASAPSIVGDKSIHVFEKHGVFTESELFSRCEIKLENYIKKIKIEALTMLHMAQGYMLPSSMRYAKKVAVTINEIKATGIDADLTVEKDILVRLSDNIKLFSERIKILREKVDEMESLECETIVKASYCRNNVFEAMEELRETGDTLETIVPKEIWPFPSYGRLLYMI